MLMFSQIFLVSTLDETGKTRDIVTEKNGISRRDAEMRVVNLGLLK